MDEWGVNVESLKGKELLIVGGTGFIGSKLACRARELEMRVTIASHDIRSKSTSLNGLLYLDVTLKDGLDGIRGREFDYVVNLGGYVNHADLHSGGFEVIQSHLIGVHYLVRALKDTGIKRYVQIGSGDEYGPESPVGQECSRGMPCTPYAYAKESASKFIEMAYKNIGFPGVALRIFLTYGPGQQLNRAIPQIIRGCLLDKEFDTSAGTQIRDFTYIDDIIDGIILSLIREEAIGEIINLGYGEGIRISEVIELIRKRVGGGRPVYGAFKYRQNESMRLVADTKKATELLGWNAKVGLSQGIEYTIEAFRKEWNL